MHRRAIAIAACCTLATGGPIAEAGADQAPKLLVFNTAFFDMMASGTGESFTTPDDFARVKQFSDTVHQSFVRSGQYRVLAQPKGPDSDDPTDLSCAACILDTARAQGADFILTSAVTRFSGAIVYLRMELDNVATEKAVKVTSVQIGGFSAAQLRQAADRAADDFLNPKPADTPHSGQDRGPGAP
ncbi:MAG: DUF2380 domain-containing protein [Acidobacteriia bacterium]|nr:DUF2380 domain-containing protein [Terriglobia bacterium]